MEFYPAEHTFCFKVLQSAEHDPTIVAASSTKEAPLRVRIHAFALRVLFAITANVASVVDLVIWTLKTVKVILMCEYGFVNHLTDLITTILGIAYAILLPVYLVRGPLHKTPSLHKTLLELTSPALEYRNENGYGLLRNQREKVLKELMDQPLPIRKDILQKIIADPSRKPGSFAHALIESRWYDFALNIIDSPEAFDMTAEELGTTDRFKSYNELFELLRDIRLKQGGGIFFCPVLLDEEESADLKALLSCAIKKLSGQSIQAFWDPQWVHYHWAAPFLTRMDLISCFLDRAKELNTWVDCTGVFQELIRHTGGVEYKILEKLVERILAGSNPVYEEIRFLWSLAKNHDKFPVLNFLVQKMPIPEESSIAYEEYKQTVLHCLKDLITDLVKDNSAQRVDVIEQLLGMIEQLLEREARWINFDSEFHRKYLDLGNHLLFFSEAGNIGDPNNFWTSLRRERQAPLDVVFKTIAPNNYYNNYYFDRMQNIAATLLRLNVPISFPELEKYYRVMNQCCQRLLNELAILPAQNDVTELQLQQLLGKGNEEINDGYSEKRVKAKKPEVIVSAAATAEQASSSVTTNRFEKTLYAIFAAWPASVMDPKDQDDTALSVRERAVKRLQQCQCYCQEWLKRLPVLNQSVKEKTEGLTKALTSLASSSVQPTSPFEDPTLTALITQYAVGAIPLDKAQLMRIFKERIADVAGFTKEQIEQILNELTAEHVAGVSLTRTQREQIQAAQKKLVDKLFAAKFSSTEEQVDEHIEKYIKTVISLINAQTAQVK